MSHVVTCRGLERIDALLSATKSVESQHLLLAKKACLLARLSQLEESRAIIDSIRAPADSYAPRLMAWIMFYEGLANHFDTLSETALRNFKRAYAVGISAGDGELAAIASAWIAAGDFIAGNFASVQPSLVRAFRYSDPSNHSALARASLVIADMYNSAGLPANARTWYRRARDHAIEEGDISMQSVTLFNDAAFRVSGIVFDDCRGQAKEHDIFLASMAIDSIASLDHGLGMRRLTSMIPLLRAEVCTVQRKWDEAIGLFDAYLRDTSVHTHERLRPKFLANRAYCNAQVGDSVGALQDIQSALETVDSCTDFDDLFVVHCRVGATYAALGDLPRSTEHQASASRCAPEFADFQSELQAAVEQIIERIRPAQEKGPA